MKQTEASPLLYFLGTVLLLGTVACLFVYHCFDGEELEIDTYDEHNEDYL